MAFQPTIDNDTVAALPAARFPGRIVIVDREEQVDAACEELLRHRVIGFDTETRPSFRAGVSYKVALLQLSTEDTCYLFRLSHIRLSNRILKILGSRQILKIGADVTGDIRSLHALRLFHADGFIDLQREASRWGIEEKSLRKLSAIVLGKRVSKAQRLSNWEAEILTEQQREYAATDAWVCVQILSALERSGKVDGKLTIISATAPNEESAEAVTRRHPRRKHKNSEHKHSKYEQREVKHSTPTQR
ncbi:MAG: 3'-5' exonuclease domain-containing protein 2 [Alistipes sp.]|nr:3'-5' exonuclease domain-containing protein 2 [Alistipes sp.]